MTSIPDSRNRWALLVGINEYPLLKPRGQLTGCINDVEVMSRTLQGPFGFPEDHVTILRDAEATRDGILAAMYGLVERVGKDEVVVFHYSGHGSRIPDREGDQPDGYDETLFPYDGGRAPHPNREITNDEIYLWLQKLTARTPHVTLIFDCCHSGTVVRHFDLDETRTYIPEVRFVEPECRPVEKLPPSPVGSLARSSLDNAPKGPSGWLPLGERYVLIAGCTAQEKSHEVQVGSPAGVRHGALTHFLIQELVKAISGTTYHDIFERFAPQVTSMYPQQHPQLEGAWDREIFGVRTIEPMVFVRVCKRSGEKVTLDAGAACGLTTGSRWAVYPSGTKKVDDEVEPLGMVEITEVRAVTSKAKIVEESEPGAVQAGTRAVEQDHCLGEARLRIEVIASEGPGKSAEYLKGRIDQSKLLQRALPEEMVDVQVRVVSPEEPFALGEESWLAVAPGEGSPLLPPRRRRDFDAVERLLEGLENEARARRLGQLRNDGSRLEGQVSFTLLRRLAHDRWEEPDKDGKGELIFFDGDQILLEVTNESDLPLFIYVLNVGVSGAVDVTYPVRGALKALEPGRKIRIGERDGDEIDLSVPDELLGFWRKLGRSSLEGREKMKLFATTHNADFSPLRSPGTRRSGGSNSLDDVLAATFGGGYRDARPRNREDREDWTTIERGYLLRAGSRVLTSSI